jgi:hypothetical protein
VLAQQPRCLGWHLTTLCKYLSGSEFYFQPLLKPVLVTPDPPHCGPCVTGDHGIIYYN